MNCLWNSVYCHTILFLVLYCLFEVCKSISYVTSMCLISYLFLFCLNCLQLYSYMIMQSSYARILFVDFNTIISEHLWTRSNPHLAPVRKVKSAVLQRMMRMMMMNCLFSVFQAFRIYHKAFWFKYAAGVLLSAPISDAVICISRSFASKLLKSGMT